MSKRQKILDAALDLFVKLGFHGTPTSKIAANAGVSNGTLFHYFPTKEVLIKELYISIKDEFNVYLFQNVQESLENTIKQAFIESINWAMANQEKFHYIYQVHFSPHIFQIPEAVIQAQTKIHFDLIERAKKEKLIKNLPSNLIFTLSNSHIMGIYTYAKTLPKAEQNAGILSGFELFWKILKF